VGTILNWLQSLLAIDRLNISYDKPSPPQFLDRRWLPSQCILHSTITFVSKGEEPSHVVSTISFSDQLVKTLEKIYWGLEPNHFTGFFLRRTRLFICYNANGLKNIGSNWTNPSWILGKRRSISSHTCIWRQ